MNKVKSFFINILDYILEKSAEYYHMYGVLGVICAVAVPLKLLLFYFLIGISTNVVFVWLVTCIFILLLFRSFRIKWIPAAVYVLLSILMFADVTYSSFFNRYLSVNMIGAAGVLTDITASIKEVIRPEFFLLFIDAILILATLTYLRIRHGKSEKKNRLQNLFYHVKINRRLEKIGAWFLRHKSPFIAIILLLLLVFNVTGSGFVTSVSNQELVSYHVKDILNGITGGENSGVKGLSAFEDSYDKEKNGPLFGVAKNRNLIVIQVESFQNFVINREYNGQEITPNLNALIKDAGTLYFDSYYHQIGTGNTSDAELATNNSICGSLQSYSYKLFDNNYFRGLPVLLKERGYSTEVLHAYWDKEFWNREKIYPKLGFDTFIGGVDGSENNSFDLTKKIGWGLADDEFFKQSIPYLKKLPQPFYSMLITLSNHHPYQMPDEYQTIKLLPEDKGTIVGNYLNSAAYTDAALGQFFQELKDAGLYDNSIIAIYGDHMGLTLTDENIEKSMTNLLGKKYDFDTMMNIPLIISIPGTNVNQTVSVAGGQLDFLPTIAYLLGFDKLDTVYLGHNMLTEKDGFVAEQTYMTKGSFFSNDVAYEMSRDGVFENGRAWNRKTGKPVPVEDCYDGYLKSMDIINTSEYILKSDALRKIYLDGKSDVRGDKKKEEKERYPSRIAIAGAPDSRLIGTNSLEALNASYDAGERYLKVDACWTTDTDERMAVLLSNWEQVPDYYNTWRKTPLSYERFHALSMKNGLTSMNYKDLADWLETHPDAHVVIDIEKNSDVLMEMINQYKPEVMDRIIPEAEGMVEYSGIYKGILDLDVGSNTPEQLLNFMKDNDVWAATMSKESAEGRYQSLLKSKTKIYISGEENGFLTKRDTKSN